MHMSSLQLGLIVAAVVLVLAVLLYNAWEERRIRRRIDQAFRGQDSAPDAGAARGEPARVEPTMKPARGDVVDANADAAQTLDAGDVRATTGPDGAGPAESSWSPPLEVIDHALEPDPVTPREQSTDPGMPRVAAASGSQGPQPDRDIECMVILQPAKPLTAGALAAGLHARVGKRLRWFGRTAPGSPWVQLNAATHGEFVELAACMLLADRNGAASHAQLETFVRVMSELAPMLPAALSVPDAGAEADRAEALDRLCADVDVQVGLTIVKQEPASIAGTRLRGVAEAAGFKLAQGGRFEWQQEDTGEVLYTMQNVRNEPFTVDTLRTSSTHGVVLVLDVPRVADPPRAFDHMKLVAKRMAHTLDGQLVDDNRRPLDDSALAVIRQQVQGAANALAACHIDPGSPRAHALFGA